MATAVWLPSSAVGNRLYRVLGVTQEFVAFAQLVHHGGRQIALPFEDFQHFKQRTLLQAKVAPAVNQLKGLGNKLDFTNPARPQAEQADVDQRKANTGDQAQARNHA